LANNTCNWEFLNNFGYVFGDDRVLLNNGKFEEAFGENILKGKIMGWMSMRQLSVFVGKEESAGNSIMFGD
jgi:hypothetical protein